jgi:hypothetical protein
MFLREGNWKERERGEGERTEREKERKRENETPYFSLDYMVYAIAKNIINGPLIKGTGWWQVLLTHCC